jgi:hypothetical protein
MTDEDLDWFLDQVAFIWSEGFDRTMHALYLWETC